MRTQSEKEKSDARKWIVIGLLALGAIAVVEFLFGGWFASIFMDTIIEGGTFSELWHPPGPRESVEGLIVSIFLPFTGLIFLGVATLIEDREVRTHRRPGPIYNPVSTSISIPGIALIVGGIILALRQLFLLIWVY